ncbi:unnamed protein product [Ranitomeya imitator]|uniref:SRCR domain-containing protein n=1 Tax=Ranitomeya imitator TaxID=111125 RepID=A0ABN9M032_9NEOB|nr:unnamed protein product [Ranitomeya imitator]
MSRLWCGLTAEPCIKAGEPASDGAYTLPTQLSKDIFPVRLVGGWDSCAGHVEIFYENAWGTVCDDGWDINDAHVVCRQLNCGKAVEALHNSYFGQGAGKMLLDNVICAGNEQYLWQCSHREWGKHDCRAHEDAGVICSEADIFDDSSSQTSSSSVILDGDRL